MYCLIFIIARSLFDDPTATEDTVRRGAKFPFLEDVFVPTEHAKETEMTEHSELLEYVNSCLTQNEDTHST